MPMKKVRRKAKPVRKAKKARKPVARKRAVKRAAAPRRAKPEGPQYSCVLCGVEVAVTKAGLGISRLMCCGQPMTRR
jgi:desulfoferrodoxin-like iron-binding protein